MAVIKIVPMPGAEGQQGETGAVGPQGPQGDTGATGPAGADAVWYYNGEYNPGASYVIGDVVTYDGQLWYRKNANGGNVGDTPSEGLFWDLLAAKGNSANVADFVFEHYNEPYHRSVMSIIDHDMRIETKVNNPGTDADIFIDSEDNVSISAQSYVVLHGIEGEFLGSHENPLSQIATLGDITTPISGTWNPRFAELSGITYSNSEQYEMGKYYCIGDLVFFDLTVHLGYVSDWGNPAAPIYNNFKFKLPFEMPASNLGVVGQSGPATRIPFLGQILENYTDPLNPATWSMFPVFGLSVSNNDEVEVYSTMGGMNQSFQPVTSLWPSNFTESQGGSNSSFSMSGVYRRA